MSDTYDIRVLVVDDSEFFAQMTSETLTDEHDIEASFETSATDALDYLESRDVDCIVSDYEMPDMNGLEFLESVRTEHPSLPFILLTGRGDEETASDAIAAGVADYLLKLEVVEDKQYGRLANRIESVVDQDRTRRKFESLVTNSPDGIAQLTVDGELLTVNPTMASRLNGTPESLVGEHLTDVMDPDVARGRIAAARETVDTGETKRIEDFVDGRYYMNQFVPVEGYRERNTVQVVSRDVTERVERERELKRQNERLERFASVVSHDLRNPLNVAQSAVALLEPEGDEADLVDKIDRSLTRMTDIVEDVLTLARQGQTVDEPQAVELDALATEAWQWVETDSSELVVDGSVTFEADPGRVQNLLSNLFRNAVEHNDDPVTITVGVLDGGFYVADDGSGLHGSVDEVFEMGYSSNDAGTGMGLAIVKQVADAHGWDVDVSSTDDGARFEITGVEPAG